MDPTDPDAPEPPGRDARPWCLFRCGRAPYAVGLGSVAEVVEVERLVPLPICPPRVLGLCSLRREVIPVIGFGCAADGPAGAPGPKLLVLILRGPRGTWGVRIDGEGTAVAEEPLDPDLPFEGGAGVTFLGTVRRDDLAYAVIDPEATWRDLRRGVEHWYGNPPGRHAAAGPADAPAGPAAGEARRERGEGVTT